MTPSIDISLTTEEFVELGSRTEFLRVLGQSYAAANSDFEAPSTIIYPLMCKCTA